MYLKYNPAHKRLICHYVWMSHDKLYVSYICHSISGVTGYDLHENCTAWVLILEVGFIFIELVTLYIHFIFIFISYVCLSNSSRPNKMYINISGKFHKNPVIINKNVVMFSSE